MSASPRRAERPIHPLVVRITHWVNALAMLMMITSGWRIYNASPIFGDWAFPKAITLGGWLGGALQWHFAAMWLLVANASVYLTYGLASGHLRRRLTPLRPAEIGRDLVAALTFRLPHRPGVYNAVQRLLYVAVLLAGFVAVLSGLAIWKPVQFAPLTVLMGGYDQGRIVHFLAMAGITAFVGVHLALVLLVPRTLPAMIVGRDIRLGPKAG
ncbi:cytochrome b/b6 domain-containing protein [Methylorubrum salsuginis]|uniref:Thiosulfate reductase cytochrome b subunit n=1 Tax=Methylorubrum salsuginis TaxID=414703 RepID=A0A1I4IXJ1_9HYPH|nr:cytochrome b/b6 domain-containing protein [Methylorubrum salsuginis]SFL59034.1 Thiosulfate reductase cytochrome b subunit [Methylorubrum salsuginis]